MGNALKGYRAFLPRPWLLWIVCIVYPLVSIAGCIALSQIMAIDSHLIIGAVVYEILLVEILLNKVSFAGIVAKDSNCLDYLKTSIKGMDVLEKVFYVDQQRRFFTTAIILICIGVHWTNITIALVVVSALELFTFLTRLFINRNVQLVITGLLFGVAASLTFVIMMVGSAFGQVLWLTTLLLIGYIVIRFITRSFLMKKARECFYDER